MDDANEWGRAEHPAPANDSRLDLIAFAHVDHERNQTGPSA
jgi:hypothetical protein